MFSIEGTLESTWKATAEMGPGRFRSGVKDAKSAELGRVAAVAYCLESMAMTSTQTSCLSPGVLSSPKALMR